MVADGGNAALLGCGPAWGAELLAALNPGDVLLTPKLDRMFRSALDALDVLAQLQKTGISLHMIDLGGDATGNEISKLVYTILSAVAEAERDRWGIGACFVKLSTRQYLRPQDQVSKERNPTDAQSSDVIYLP
jgi:resolvase-like protein